MSLSLIFTILVVMGFAFHFLATFNTPAYASRIAWGSWLCAALIWASQSGAVYT